MTRAAWREFGWGVVVGSLEGLLVGAPAVGILWFFPGAWRERVGIAIFVLLGMGALVAFRIWVVRARRQHRTELVALEARLLALDRQRATQQAQADTIRAAWVAERAARLRQQGPLD